MKNEICVICETAAGNTHGPVSARIKGEVLSLSLLYLLSIHRILFLIVGVP